MTFSIDLELGRQSSCRPQNEAVYVASSAVTVHFRSLSVCETDSVALLLAAIVVHLVMEFVNY